MMNVQFEDSELENVKSSIFKNSGDKIDFALEQMVEEILNSTSLTEGKGNIDDEITFEAWS